MQCIMGLLRLIKMHMMLSESDRNKVFLKVAFFVECALKGTHLVLEPVNLLIYLLFLILIWMHDLHDMHIKIKSKSIKSKQK